MLHPPSLYEDLARRYGTPFYLYDLPTLRRQSESLREGFGDGAELLFAVKANPSGPLLRWMGEEQLVDGLDIASSGELGLALDSGWAAERLSYAGPAKSQAMLEEALKAGVGTLCLESLREWRGLLALLDELSLPEAPGVMLRLNPAMEFHAFGMKTSGSPSPFGIDEEELESTLCAIVPDVSRVRFEGIHVHVGSQCFSAKALARSMSHAVDLAVATEALGLPVSCINFGGGFGVPGWREGQMPNPKSVARLLQQQLSAAGLELRVRLEPGRFLTGPAGTYVARVISSKRSRGQEFFILDGGMNHYFSATEPRFQKKHKAWWVENLSRPDAPPLSCQLTGPLCTPRDQVGFDLLLPRPEIGDLLAWPNAGSYGLSASPFMFLGHPTPAELLFDGREFRCIRRPFHMAQWSEATAP